MVPLRAATEELGWAGFTAFFLRGRGGKLRDDTCLSVRNHTDAASIFADTGPVMVLGLEKLKRWQLLLAIAAAVIALPALAYKSAMPFYEYYKAEEARRAAFQDRLNEIRNLTTTLRDTVYAELISAQLENFETALDAWETVEAVPQDIKIIPVQITTNRGDVQVIYVRMQEKLDALELSGEAEALRDIAGLMERVRLNSKSLFDFSLARFSEPEFDISRPDQFDRQKARWAEMSIALRDLLTNETYILLSCVDTALATIAERGAGMPGKVCEAERAAYLEKHVAILRQ